MTLLSLKIRGHRTSEKWLCHEESQKLVHGSEPIWTPQIKLYPKNLNKIIGTFHETAKMVNSLFGET